MGEIHGVGTELTINRKRRKRRMEYLTTLNLKGLQHTLQRWINQSGDNYDTRYSTHGSTFC